jgi:hypothetical protein
MKARLRRFDPARRVIARCRVENNNPVAVHRVLEDQEKPHTVSLPPKEVVHVIELAAGESTAQAAQ